MLTSDSRWRRTSSSRPSNQAPMAASSAGRFIAGSIPYPRRTVRLVEIRLLEGPNIYRLEPAVRIEVAAGRAVAWRGPRLPPRSDWLTLGRHVPPHGAPGGGARIGWWVTFLSRGPQPGVVPAR